MTFKIKNRHRIKSKDIKKIFSEIQKSFPDLMLNEKSNVETGEIEEYKLVFVDDTPCFMYHNDRLIFTLIGINKFNPRAKFVEVDMGAVRFVTNGADVMAPGIVDADISIVEDDVVWICDQKHKKPLAVGYAVMNGEQMISEKKGKAINVIHYVGDRLWNFSAKSL